MNKEQLIKLINKGTVTACGLLESEKVAEMSKKEFFERYVTQTVLYDETTEEVSPGKGDGGDELDKDTEGDGKDSGDSEGDKDKPGVDIEAEKKDPDGATDGDGGVGTDKEVAVDAPKWPEGFRVTLTDIPTDMQTDYYREGTNIPTFFDEIDEGKYILNSDVFKFFRTDLRNAWDNGVANPEGWSTDGWPEGWDFKYKTSYVIKSINNIKWDNNADCAVGNLAVLINFIPK